MPKRFKFLIVVLFCFNIVSCGGGSGSDKPQIPSIGDSAAQIYTQHHAISALQLIGSGGASISSCSADYLPAGLSVASSADASRCEITGTPTVAQIATLHTITATNAIGSDTAEVSITVRGGASLDLSFAQVKTFSFGWDAVGGEDHYNLLENADGISGYSIVDTVAADTQAIDHVVPLYARVNAEYILETCYSADDSICVDSNAVSVNDEMVSGIGYVKASNTDSIDYFGTSVALSGDGNTLAVGAFAEKSGARGVAGDQTDNSTSAAGAVYVFNRSGNTWSQQAYLKASNTEANEGFGTDIAISENGSTLAVAAMLEDSSAEGVGGDQDDNSASNSGAVYVYNRANSTWFEPVYLKASNTQSNDRFGGALALSGDGNTLAVGAYGEDGGTTGVNGNQADNSALDSGAVYIFGFSDGSWSSQAYLKASNTGEKDRFGGVLALSGDGRTLAVGAYSEASNATGVGGNQANNSMSESGAVYIFARIDNAWSHQSYLKASNTGEHDRFGAAVALSMDGSTLAVGAYFEGSSAIEVGGDQNDNSSSESGATYVFRYSDSTWSQQAYVKASNTGENDRFGYSVALGMDGNTLVVGARREGSSATGVEGEQSDNSAYQSGAAYVFIFKDEVWSQLAYIKASNTGKQDGFGTVVALSGDGNSLAVSAMYEDGSATGLGGDQSDDSLANAGAVYLY